MGLACSRQRLDGTQKTFRNAGEEEREGTKVDVEDSKIAGP
jgi:hypothetical protein